MKVVFFIFILDNRLQTYIIDRNKTPGIAVRLKIGQDSGDEALPASI